MGNHNGGIKRCKIQSGDGILIEAHNRVQDVGSLIADLVIVFGDSFGGANIIVLLCLSQQLTHDLDLLAPTKQEVDRDSCDTGHLRVVIQAAKLVHESEG